MKHPTTVFGNLLSHFPRSEFEKAVFQYGGDKGVRVLDCFNLFKTLVFGQLTQAFSVREIESSMAAQSRQLYHCGLKPVKRSTLCDALEKRDPVIFERTFEALVSTAQRLSRADGRRFRSPLKIIDASTIELCLAQFDWAKFRTTKGAVKIHVALNGEGLFPEKVQITPGAVHEVRQLATLTNASDTIYVMDRGYVDFKRLWDINLSGSIFVTRVKENCQCAMVKMLYVTQKGPIRLDNLVKLTGQKSTISYPENLRQVAYQDPETGKKYIFMTNDFISPAQDIADIYKARWQVELFFKWVKQNLKIKTFLGTSQKAVFTQIWVALIVFMLLWISKKVNGLAATKQRIIQLLKTSLMSKRSILDLFKTYSPPGITHQYLLCLKGGKN